MSITYFNCTGCGRHMNDAEDDFRQCLVCDRAWCLPCGEGAGVRQCKECEDDYCQDCEGKEGVCSNCSEPAPPPAVAKSPGRSRSRKAGGDPFRSPEGQALKAIRAELKTMREALASLTKRVARLEKGKPDRP
jgi:hypothetical protein